MSRRRPPSNLYKWIAISLAAHVILLLLPAHIFEAIFFQRTGGFSGGSRDLTPDFADIALSVLNLPSGPVVQVPAEQPDETAEAEEAPLPSGPPSGSPPADSPGEGTGSGEGMGSGEGPSVADAVFFPARPRLIVPPAMDDLRIKSLSVDLRILVDADGIPRQVILPDSLVGTEIGGRLLESARRFRFEPARKGDLPVQSWVDLPLLLES